MNPIFQYLMIKSHMVTQAECPHCQHSFEILRKDSHRQARCLKCGKLFTVKPPRKKI